MKSRTRSSTILTFGRSESAAAPSPALEDASAGKTTFSVYEGYMSPPQQPGEETDAPKLVAKLIGLETTVPSVPR